MQGRVQIDDVEQDATMVDMKVIDRGGFSVMEGDDILVTVVATSLGYGGRRHGV